MRDPCSSPDKWQSSFRHVSLALEWRVEEKGYRFAKHLRKATKATYVSVSLNGGLERPLCKAVKRHLTQVVSNIVGASFDSILCLNLD